MRLEVTRKSDLALRSMHELSAADDRLKGPELAELVGSTPAFVSQAITPLVRAGWVKSDPGPTGGYSLAADLEQVSIRQVIEAIEGPTDLGRCVLAEKPCEQDGHCALHEPWLRARSQLLDELDSTSVADTK